jgi:hypothetical protein
MGIRHRRDNKRITEIAITGITEIAITEITEIAITGITERAHVSKEV